MHYVYILQSENEPERFYVGHTHDLRQRIGEHNRGAVRFTARSRPWKMKFYGAFEDAERAVAFEKYMKTGSGRAFVKKRL